MIHVKEPVHDSIKIDIKQMHRYWKRFVQPCIAASVKHSVKWFNFHPVNQVLLHGRPNAINYSCFICSSNCKFLPASHPLNSLDINVLKLLDRLCCGEQYIIWGYRDILF